MHRVCLLLITVTLVGCGDRAEVAKEKLLSKIDSILGEMDVKRKQIESSVDAFKEGIDGLRKAKIKSQVRQDQIARQVAPLELKLKELDTSLGTLRDRLASGEAAEFGGKTYSPDELKVIGDKLLAARRQLVDQIGGYEKSKVSLQKVVDTLERKQSEYQQRLNNLENQIAEIDSKTVALKAMKDASAAMGKSEESMAQNVDALEDSVNDLYAEVEGELLGEDEKWNAEEATAEINSVDAFIAATQKPTDTLAEIDKILQATE